MKIIEALKSENLRISNGDKWLYYDNITNEWIVRQHKYRKKSTDILTSTPFQEEAVRILLEG